MSDNDMTRMSDLEKQVEDEIEKARSQLTTVVLAKQKEVILKMGEALEKIWDGEKRSSICEELKERLREEIAQGIIAKRTVELHCKPQWKRQDKVKFGKKGSEIKKKLAANSAATPKEEAEQVPPPPPQGPTGDTTLLVTENGSQERQAHESDDDDSDVDRRHDRHEQEHAPMEDERLRKLEEELKQEKEQKLALVEHNNYLQAQLQQAQHEDRDALGQRNNVDFEFYLLLREVRPYMQLRYKANGGDSAQVWFHGSIDPRTGKVVRASCGRKEEAGDVEAGA
jgi:hypothetical protein